MSTFLKNGGSTEKNSGVHRFDQSVYIRDSLLVAVEIACDKVFSCKIIGVICSKTKGRKSELNQNFFSHGF